MRLLLDECLPNILLRELEKLGFNVKRSKQGQSDVEVIGDANEAERILVTFDLDFGDLTIRDDMASSGVIILEEALINGQNDETVAMVAQRIHDLSNDLAGRLTIIRKNKTRVRRLKRPV